MQTKEVISFDPLRDMRSNYPVSLFQDGVVVGEEEVLLFGPYVKLPAGKWTVSVVGHAVPTGPCYVDGAAGGGNLILAANAWSGDRCSFEVDCLFPLDDFEVRVHASTGSFIRIESISVERQFDRAKSRSFSIYERVGLSLLLDSTSWVDHTIIQSGAWEPEHLSYLTSQAYRHAASSRDLLFLDIGAYFGLYSMIMAKTNLFSTVVSFEADVLNFRQLCANLLLNDASCLIEPRFIAVSDRVGESLFDTAMSHPDGNRGGVGLKEQGTEMSEGRRRVITDTIDRLLPTKGRKIFAKIDVEGHELKVLTGMRNTILCNKVFLQIETFFQLQEVKDVLEPLGCRMVHQIESDYFFSNYEI